MNVWFRTPSRSRSSAVFGLEVLGTSPIALLGHFDLWFAASVLLVIANALLLLKKTPVGIMNGASLLARRPVALTARGRGLVAAEHLTLRRPSAPVGFSSR